MDSIVWNIFDPSLNIFGPRCFADSHENRKNIEMSPKFLIPCGIFFGPCFYASGRQD